MDLNSNPKGYNIDKVLEFLSQENSVLLFYLVGISQAQPIKTSLVSMFQSDLLSGTLLLSQWSGRNSRGVTQFKGQSLENLIFKSDQTIHIQESRQFLNDLVNL